MLIKSNIKLNKYADCFLKPKKTFANLSNMAYGDMARHTLHIDDTEEEKQTKRDAATRILEKAILDYSGEPYDEWHKDVCEKIKDCYGVYGDAFRHGQAQKWLNMLIKYIYVYDLAPYNKFFDYFDLPFIELHAPLDNKVIGMGKKLGISYPSAAWSRMDYSDYQSYQNKLRDALKVFPFDNPHERSRFLWEIINWS